MNAELPKSNSVEHVDEAMLQKMWPALSDAVEAVKASPFSGKVKGFIPLSLSRALEGSGLLVEENIPEEHQPLFEGFGKEYKYTKDLTDDLNFAKLDLAEQGGKFIGSFRVHQYEAMGAETYCAVDIVLYQDQDGEIKATPIVKKAITAGPRFEGGLQKATQDRANKLKELEDAGIPVIHLHGVAADEAILYEALYTDGKKEIYKSINEDEAAAAKYLPSVVDMAKRLDEQGYGSVDFLRDIVYDGERFLYLDAGADVGWAGEDTDTTGSLELLMNRFPEHQDLIQDLYFEKDLDAGIQGISTQVSDTMNNRPAA